MCVCVCVCVCVCDNFLHFKYTVMASLALHSLPLSLTTTQLQQTTLWGFPSLSMLERPTHSPSFLSSTLCFLNCSVVSSSLWPPVLQPARLLCPWDFPRKNTGVGCHFLIQSSTLVKLIWFSAQRASTNLTYVGSSQLDASTQTWVWWWSKALAA